MLTLPPRIVINTGTGEQTGVVMTCREPECQWAWTWAIQPVSDDELRLIADAHRHDQHPEPA